MVVSRQRVLVEGVARRDSSEMMGRTDNNRVIHFPGAVRVGELVDVDVTRSNSHSLSGAAAVTD